MGTELIAWTVRLGVICFAVVLGGWGVGQTGSQNDRRQRLIWTCGWCFFLLHMLAAFQFQHRWSHAQAVADTAKQTGELLGWEFGGGVYFNYFFLVVWGLDVVLWWLGRQSAIWYRPWRKIALAYLIFMAINGVVIFKSGWIRWTGMAATLTLLGIWLNRIRISRLINRQGKAI